MSHSRPVIGGAARGRRAWAETLLRYCTAVFSGLFIHWEELELRGRKTTIFLITGGSGTGYLPPLCCIILWFLEGYYVFFLLFIVYLFSFSSWSGFVT
ncbi:hypothetical protein GGR51DRAFT_539424 [Nemania sp. FL0031]|nr:hypothetical protein GGR51DRAFT_539424 [Nemania sp. FL0031]